MMIPPYGREWLSLAHMSPADQELMHWFATRFHDYSPDAKRLVRGWLEKFDAGVVEHGPLRIASLRPLTETVKEFADATSYLQMAIDMMTDLDRLMRRVESGETPQPQELSANDLRG